MTEKIITQKRLKKLLRYDPGTGIFTWVAPVAQRVNVGDTAGCLNPYGYIVIKINNRLYRAHRLAFLYMTGKFPVDQTDHRNHIRNDNRWKNLREADNFLNHRNKSMYNTNTSGYVGVCWAKRDRRWYAHIRVNGKQINLGYFTNITDAIEARKAANIRYGFHENHGNIKAPPL